MTRPLMYLRAVRRRSKRARADSTWGCFCSVLKSLRYGQGHFTAALKLEPRHLARFATFERVVYSLHTLHVNVR